MRIVYLEYVVRLCGLKGCILHNGTVDNGIWFGNAQMSITFVSDDNPRLEIVMEIVFYQMVQLSKY